MRHPSIFQDFGNGSFVIHNSRRPFSAIALDHAHKQENALIKGDGGAVSLTENAGALRRWMVSWPETARMIAEFDNVSPSYKTPAHHEKTPSVQVLLRKDVRSVVTTFEELGNPFEEDGEELIALHTKDVMNSEVVRSEFGTLKELVYNKSILLFKRD